MKKLLCLLLSLAMLTGLTACGDKQGVNIPDGEAGKSVPGAFHVYGGDDMGFGFLYPADMTAEYSEEDGVCISREGSSDYLLVKMTDKKGMTPEKYYKSSDKQIIKTFSGVQSTPIYEVPVEGKTLYLTRYQCKNGGSQVTIDRYIELYRDCYIQYTAVSGEAGAMNTAVYYAAKTLSVTPGAYVGQFSERTAHYQQGDTGFDLHIPVMLKTKELTIGYYASADDAVMLCVVCREDDDGRKIYNRQDFIDRASVDASFVASYLGADYAEFSGGTEETINGRSYYSYPMELTIGADKFSGRLSIANYDESGCVLLCYCVREESGRFDDISRVCADCLKTVKF